jgi:phage baseplate assembly protein W
MASLTSKNLFVGYSTVGSFNSHQLTDIALVQQDLLNAFYTKKGERVMMPSYGFGGWDYLFDPINDVRDLIIHESEQVIANDPRVKLQTINVVQQEYGISIQMELYYVPYNAYGAFSINFDNRSQLMARS